MLLGTIIDHRLNGHEFLQTQGDSEGQGSLACCSPWGCKELDLLSDCTTTIIEVYDRVPYKTEDSIVNIVRIVWGSSKTEKNKEKEETTFELILEGYGGVALKTKKKVH